MSTLPVVDNLLGVGHSHLCSDLGLAWVDGLPCFAQHLEGRQILHVEGGYSISIFGRHNTARREEKWLTLGLWGKDRSLDRLHSGMV